MILTLDVENTVSNRGGKKQLDPFEEGNTLVMIGCKPLDEPCQVYTFDHAEVQEDIVANRKAVQDLLDKTTLMIGQNISHDLMWLWESGFNYDGPVFDTMLSDYVLQRGQKVPLDLGSIAIRYGSEILKQDTLKEYFKKGYSTRDIPHAELSMYLEHDLGATEHIYKSIQRRLLTPEDCGLASTIDMTNETTIVLARMYQTGVKIDRKALDDVRTEFENEKQETEILLQSHIRQLMGDTPINLNSPEQLSWVVYSRKPYSKDRWATAITPYMTDQDFKLAMKQHFAPVYKTKAVKCEPCDGKGFVYKVKKDGSPFKKANKCTTCNGSGFEFKPTKDVAGLKFTPPSAKWASANGFGTSKENLETLERVALSKGMHDAVEFLSKLRRLSALDSYLSNFVDGITNFVKTDDMLHVRLNQHITATGRFSGANPNFQNLPRGGTFPIKKVIVSRWANGSISEWDFAQLEFRVAGILSGDELIKQEVVGGFDVHSYTAKVISDAGQPTTRQGAKAHTFAPLYGATGYGRTPAEAAYYTHFMDKYSTVAQWHKTLAKQVLNYGIVKLPSGREYTFPNTKRKKDGSVTNFTAIKNYPVQGFATADIVPLVLIEVHKRFKAVALQSCVVNSVHDSIVLDVHPAEKAKVKAIMEGINTSLTEFVSKRFNVDITIPLVMEGSIGKTWLDQEDWV